MYHCHSNHVLQWAEHEPEVIMSTLFCDWNPVSQYHWVRYPMFHGPPVLVTDLPVCRGR